MVGLSALYLILAPAECSAQSGWSKIGTAKFTMASGDVDEEQTRYLHKNSLVRFRVREFVEKDTYTDAYGTETEYGDNQRKITFTRISSTEATLFGSLTDPGEVLMTVPGTWDEGKQFVVQVDAGDTRTGDDPRKDGMRTVREWTFKVASACPEGLAVVEITDPPPAMLNGGTSHSKGIATMKVIGNMDPDGAGPRTNWNGTELLEDAGVTEGDAGKFVPAAIGRVFTTSSFTIGDGGDNVFRDNHEIHHDFMVLKTGIVAGDLTHTQRYICNAGVDPATAPTSYAYTVTHAFVRGGVAPDDFCRGTVAK
jgi:hypothetical protein